MKRGEVLGPTLVKYEGLQKQKNHKKITYDIT